MNNATYIQKGETLNYTNNTSSTIEANSIIDLKSRIAVAGDTIAAGSTGVIHVTGVFEINKIPSEAITMGTLVYFDGSAITAIETENTPAGYAASDAKTTDATILVKLLG